MKTEHMWWRFRHMWVPGFGELLERGVTNQWDDVNNLKDSCTVDDPEGKNASEGGADIVRPSLPPSPLCKWSPSYSDCTALK